MRILYVGNCNHYFNRKLVEELKKFNSQLTIDFFSTEIPKHDLQLPYDLVYDSSINRGELNFLRQLPGIYSMYCYKKWKKDLIKILQTNYYDFIHLQSLEVWHRGIEQFHKSIIITIWGSDFLRLSANKIDSYRNLISKACRLTFATPELSELFHQQYQSQNKHVLVRFGLNVFNEIDLHRNLQQKNERIVVTVGYNRHPAQQHLKILKEIGTLDGAILSNIELILPLTYGPADYNYLSQIKNTLKQLGCNYRLYEDFLSEKEIAQLCLQSDIMIQLQTTDAFSGSMQEYMYADNIVITGKWLNYQSLLKAGVNFYEINEMEELRAVLHNAVVNITSEKQEMMCNHEKLFQISSWQSNIRVWAGLYK